MRMIRPPFIAFALLAGAVVAAEVMHLPSLLGWPWRLVGLVPLGLGFACAGAALGWFRRRGTPHDPYAHPTALVVDGPYRITRNPMYVGVALVLLGIALLRPAWPYFVPPPLFLLAVRLWFVPREERRLEAAFGDDYLAFKARVRRWL